MHPIPANDAKAEPAHQHFDLRFLFTTRTAGVVTLQAEEVNDFAWLPLNGIEPKHLRARLATMLG